MNFIHNIPPLISKRKKKNIMGVIHHINMCIWHLFPFLFFSFFCCRCRSSSSSNILLHQLVICPLQFLLVFVILEVIVCTLFRQRELCYWWFSYGLIYRNWNSAIEGGPIHSELGGFHDSRVILPMNGLSLDISHYNNLPILIHWLNHEHCSYKLLFDVKLTFCNINTFFSSLFSLLFTTYKPFRIFCIFFFLF